MRNLPSYENFLNESLVILSMKGLMKNEFMNNIELKADFEMAKRLKVNIKSNKKIQL